MSDTLTNALAQSAHSQSVLAGIQNPAVVNPLAGYGSAVNLVSGMQGLAAKQGEQLVGQALQQATDPATGVLDTQKAQRIAAGMGPNAAYAMQGFLKTGSQLRGEQITQAGGLDTLTSTLAASAIADSSDENLAAIRARGVANGMPPSALAEIDRIAALPPAQRKLEAWKHLSGQMGASYNLAAGGFPTPERTNVGPNIVPTGLQPPTPYSPGGLNVQPGGVGLGMSPENTAAYQQWLKTGKDYPDPANPTVTKHGTNETYLRDTGVPDKFIYPGGAPATPGTQPSGASPLGTGRPPPALLNPNKPQATSTPTPAPSPAGTGISGPTPAQKAIAGATEEQGKLSPPRFQAEADAGTLAQSQQATLGNMLADTAQFTTGPLAGIVGKVRNLAGNFGLNINTEAQSAKESFNKLAAGLANAQGAGSDQRMAVNIDANPHVELSPAGVDLVTRQLQGNADYLQARAKLAQQYPNKADYPGFQQSVADLDPRVFQLTRMTDPQRQTYWKSLDTAAQKQLSAAIKKAKDMGVLGGG